MSSEYHDANGKFKKGNLAQREKVSGVQYFEHKRATKKELMECARSLTKPWATLKEDLSSGKASRLEYLTAKAVSEGQHKFIQWLIEMTIGKPKQTFEELSGSSGKVFTLQYKIDGEGIKNGDEEERG